MYTVYKITNLINGKIYIGAHKTNNLDDGYMGSGLALKRAIHKYGVENFNKEYIAIFDNSKEMFDMEAELVNEAFVKDEFTYNIKLGGCGGFDYINSKKLNLYGLNGHNLNSLKNLINTKDWINSLSEDEYVKHCNKLSEGAKNHYKNGGENPFKNKTHSEETKRKIGEANSNHQQGKFNSQYGTMWIYNLELKQSKKIKKGEFPEYESLGWLKGRKIKFNKAPSSNG